MLKGKINVPENAGPETGGPEDFSHTRGARRCFGNGSVFESDDLALGHVIVSTRGVARPYTYAQTRSLRELVCRTVRATGSGCPICREDVTPAVY